MSLLAIAAGVAGVKIATGIIQGTAEYFSSRSKTEIPALNSFKTPEPVENNSFCSYPQQQTNSNFKCRGCHACLTGRSGEPVKCEYCDTIQTNYN